MVPLVLQMVPDPVDALEELVPDFLGVLDDIPIGSGKLDPPVAGVDLAEIGERLGGSLGHYPACVIDCLDAGKVGTIAKVMFGIGIGPGRLDIGNRTATVHCLKEDRVPHGVPVCLFRGILFLEFRAGFAAVAEGGSRLLAQGPVSRGIHENPGSEPETLFGGHLIATDGPDGAVLHLHIAHRRVQVSVQVLLEMDLLPEHRVPDAEAVAWVPPLVLQQQLLDDAGLVDVFLRHVTRSTHDMHADFARGVAPEHRPVLDDGGLRPVTRAGDRGGDTRQATTHHDYLIGPFQNLLLHSCLVLQAYGTGIESHARSS